MITVKTILVTPFGQNCRVVSDSVNNTCFVVDPGGDVDLILTYLNDNSLQVESVFMTHAHIDHIGGVKALLSSLPNTPRLFGSDIEKDMRSSIEAQASMFGVSGFNNAPEPTDYLADGDSFEFSDISGEILFTPGHSPGHLSLYFSEDNFSDYPWKEDSETTAPLLIAGDALFQGSIGRTDLPGGDYNTLINSIKNKLLVLPENTVVLSGHGENTTIGVEKASNPFLV